MAFNFRIFKTFFLFEWKRFFGKRNVILILLLLFLSVISIQNGVSEYKDILNRKEKFQEFERKKVTHYLTYSQYGAYGVRTLFVPASMSVFFIHSGVIPELTSYVDSGERLKIYQPLKGKNIFSLKKFGFTDFSGVILFFGGLLALFFGYDTFSNREYLKMLSSLSSRGGVFFSLMVSRILLMALILVSISITAYVQILLNSIRLHLHTGFLYFLLSILLVSLFFFTIGAILGTVRSKILGITALLSIWFILQYFIPTAVNTYIARRSDLITPLYQLEMDKLVLLMDYENRTYKEAGRAKSGKDTDEQERKIILDYWENEFVKFQALEENMRGQMKNNVSLFQQISMFFPSTFYLSATNELSSKGYENLIEFYRYVQNLKRDFVEFYMKKRYFSNFSQVESFIKGGEDVFYANSRAPGYYFIGVLLNLLYIIFFIQMAYTRFRRSLLTVTEDENGDTFPGELKLEKGDFKVLVSEGKSLKNLLFNVFSGEREALDRDGYTLPVSVAGQPVAAKNRQPFVYICHPEHIPGDIKVGHLLQLVRHMQHTDMEQNGPSGAYRDIKSLAAKQFALLKSHEKGMAILALLESCRCGIYLVHDTARSMPIELTVQLKEAMEALSRDGALVLYLTPDELINVKSLEKGRGFYESTTWGQLVNHYKGLLGIGGK